MSAQKLQGQKAQAQRPTSPLGQELISRKSNETESRSRKHRYSDASIVTLEHQNRPMVDADAPPVPVSRGTAATQADTNVDGTTLRSTRTGGSSAPLHRGERPSHLDLRAAKNGSAPPAAKSPKSAKSLRASLGLSSRNGRDRSQNNTRTSGHEKLYSEPPSPKPDPEKAPRDTKRKKSLGRNWEYYNGNAILPRGLHPHPPAPRNEDPLALGPPTTDWVTVRSFKPEPSSTSDSGGPGPATAMEVPVKYCKSEYLNSHKFLPKDRHRPFSQESVLRNWASILLRPRTPQYMRFKGRYQEGDQRLGVRRKSRWRPEPESQDEEKGAMEMKEMPGGETGFQGPASRGRGTINNTPRYDGVTNGGARA
ncbi:Eukaryotic peptide chain release factor GTP-binding subunit [Taxawa tesnikishii (nom. ined.)]|nr:Eukaryotic peptide chain release factor GTP-binding subunit [Dothideales sp. JES 119]